MFKSNIIIKSGGNSSGIREISDYLRTHYGMESIDFQKAFLKHIGLKEKEYDHLSASSRGSLHAHFLKHLSQTLTVPTVILTDQRGGGNTDYFPLGYVTSITGSAKKNPEEFVENLVEDILAYEDGSILLPAA